MKALLIATALCCATIAPARADPGEDRYNAAAPPHLYFSYNAPEAPSGKGPFGFFDSTATGFAGQWLREDHYGETHGLHVQADCDFASCPCPSPYYRNSTNCAPVVMTPRPAPPDDPCVQGICERDPYTNNEEQPD